MDIIPAQVFTQIVGFLLLLWLLRKFAWTPMLTGLDDRRKTIATAFSDIKATKDDLARLQGDYEARVQEIEKQARVRIQEGIAEGERIARGITDQARTDANAILSKAKENIASEVASARMQIRNEVANLALKTAEKVIRSEINEQKNKAIILQYMEELKY
jgi:F-type H+-transporting ATPase subunit b